jgi:phosphopantothenoylcysteine decarboxylase/phosphopantothenate--cysteine ligase
MHPTKLVKGSKGETLKGKTIVLGITGSIAAVKCVELARGLIRLGAEVHAVMTREACRILHPNAMEYATGNPVVTELTGKVEHVRFCGVNGEADLLLVAPCTANTIGKIVWGIDDTAVSSFATTALGSKKKMLLVPAMHISMYENEFVKENLLQLKSLGVSFVKPLLEEGAAKFPRMEDIVLECGRALSKGLLKGKRVLVASGATQEDIDAVRVITSRASGLTGIEIAKECYRQGATVTMVHNRDAVSGGIKNIRVRTGAEMEKAVLQELKKGYDLYISPVALGDFGIRRKEGKIKSNRPVLLELQPKPKLVDAVRKKFPEVEIVAFKAESGVPEKELVKKARGRMAELRSRVIVANDVAKGGMGTAENTVLIISKEKTRKVRGNKEEIATAIVEEIATG